MSTCNGDVRRKMYRATELSLLHCTTLNCRASDPAPAVRGGGAATAASCQSCTCFDSSLILSFPTSLGRNQVLFLGRPRRVVHQSHALYQADSAKVKPAQRSWLRLRGGRDELFFTHEAIQWMASLTPIYARRRAYGIFTYACVYKIK